MKKNRVISNDAAGETLTMLVSGEENSGACQLYEVGLPPRPSPPLPAFPRSLQSIASSCAAFVTKLTGFEKSWQVYFT
jgi:hypothetical protein